MKPTGEPRGWGVTRLSMVAEKTVVVGISGCLHIHKTPQTADESTGLSDGSDP